MKVTSDSRGKPTTVVPGLGFPQKVTVSVEDLNGFDLEVDVVPRDRRIVAQEVRVRQRPDGPPVTSEALRAVRVGEFVRYAAREWSTEQETRDGVTVFTTRVLDADLHRRLGPEDETLRWVAYIYRLAVATGDPPTREVEKAFGIPRSTAGRWVALARDPERGGYLDPAEGPGKAGG